MIKGKKSKKLLLITTVMTILALVSVVATAAVLLGTYQGGAVTIGGVGSGTITYSTDNSAGATWTTTLQSGSTSTPWFTRLEISTANTYSGPVTISWQLQQQTGPSTWSSVGSPVTTTTTLISGAQIVYASADGLITANTNWSTIATGAGTYRVTATVNSA